MTSKTIIFDSVSKTFGNNHAISDLSLEMPSSGIVGLIGRNGAGKTTLLNLASSLTLPCDGSIRVFGEPSSKLSNSAVGSIGVVPHRPTFMEGFSCQQYLNLVSTFYTTWDQERVNRLMKEFSLNPNQRILGLSEGQRQMLSIIVATAFRPKILLMDEPMSNLDPLSRANTIQMLWDMILDDDVLIVISSHVLSDIEKIADWITFLEGGRKKEHDSLDNIRQRFQQWEILDPGQQLEPGRDLPGVFNSRYDGHSWIVQHSQATHPLVCERKQALNGKLQVRHLSLDEIFPHLNPEAGNE